MITFLPLPHNEKLKLDKPLNPMQLREVSAEIRNRASWIRKENEEKHLTWKQREEMSESALKN